MPRVLIIKTSSLGDVIHNLPIVNDLHRAVPGLTIDWLVEEAYVDLLHLHPGLSRIVPVALRRWKKDWRSKATRDERAAFRASLAEQHYDIVLDTQGLLKSALIARSVTLAEGGKRIGYSFRSARESLASLLYDQTYSIDPRLHAVERLRSLAAQAFDYTPAPQPDFGLQVPSQNLVWLPSQQPYAVLLHATSRAEKAWPDAHWIALAQKLGNVGITAVFPWGSEAEQERARTYRQAAGSAAIVAPQLSLAEMAALLAGAVCVVGVDTGLTHLAAALERPTVGLFGATPRWRYAPYWTPRAINLGEHNVQPTLKQVVDALGQLGISST